jgi:hypothetical protein
MTQDEIIRMAREAGLHKMIRHKWEVEVHTETLSPKLERFAALVAEATKAQPQGEPVAWVNTRYNIAFVPPEGFNVYECDAYKAGELKPTFFAEQMQTVKQEPVAWRVTGPFEDIPFKDKSSAEAYRKGLNDGYGSDAYSVTPLSTTPVSAKREWVDLESWQLCEIEERVGLPIDSHDFETIGNAYIAAFKEKNT